MDSSHHQQWQWNGADDLDGLYDMDEKDAFYTVEDFQKIVEQESAADHRGNIFSDDTEPNATNVADDNNDAHPEALASIRMSAMVANNSSNSNEEVRPGHVVTAAQVLNVHAVDEEREITRLLSRWGLQGGPSHERTLSAEKTQKSAFGEAPQRLAVGGLQDVYIPDSYFLEAATQTINRCMAKDGVVPTPLPDLMECAGSISAATATTKLCKQPLATIFLSPRERYMQRKANSNTAS